MYFSHWPVDCFTSQVSVGVCAIDIFCALGPLKVYFHCLFLGCHCCLFLDETPNLCQVKLDSTSAWVSWQNFHGTSNIGPFLSHVTSNFAIQYIASEKYNWSFLGGTLFVGVAPEACCGWNMCWIEYCLLFVYLFSYLHIGLLIITSSASWKSQ